MKYKGKELKEANGKDYPPSVPKKMLVWDSGNKLCQIREVVGFINGRWAAVDVVDGMGTCDWDHAAEIPTEEETLLTNRELVKWLAQGNGERLDENGCARIQYCYSTGTENEVMNEKEKIRKWDDTEWHEPTREYAFGEVKNEA